MARAILKMEVTEHSKTNDMKRLEQEYRDNLEIVNNYPAPFCPMTKMDCQENCIAYIAPRANYDLAKIPKGFIQFYPSTCDCNSIYSNAELNT